VYCFEDFSCISYIYDIVNLKFKEMKSDNPFESVNIVDNEAFFRRKE